MFPTMKGKRKRLYLLNGMTDYQSENCVGMPYNMATSFVNSTKESLYMSLERIGIDITSTPDFHKNAIEYANKRFEIRNSQYKEELVEGLKV